MPLCGNCFHEYNAAGPCPVCGYDGSGDAKRHPQALRPGTILNGRYTVGRVLGQGGFGITYLALDEPSKERVAIKEYYPTELAGRTTDGRTVAIHSEERGEDFLFGKSQFLGEAMTLAAVSGSRNIVHIYSYFEENGTAYFAMEYVEGVPLNTFLRRRNSLLPAAEAEGLFLPLMDALESVHRKGIIHRDISPDNIIVTPDGTAKLIDFGAARYSTGEKSKSLDVILKHGFAPYEQYMRRGRQGPWTDVYALAATFYYAVTGRVPPEAVERMQGDTLAKPTELGVRLGAGTEAVLLKALSVQAPDRWQSMADFRRAMQAAAMAEAARPEGSAHPAAQPLRAEGGTDRPAGKKRSPLPLILGAVLALALVIFGVMKLTAEPKSHMEWAFDEATGTLTISGQGKMENYNTSSPDGNPAPWGKHADAIRTVIIQDGITSIAHNSFSHCDHLTSVTIPDSVTSIGGAVFLDCTSLTSVTIPNSVTSIGPNAFSGCARLTSAAIPDGVTSIEYGTFYHCAQLKSVSIPNSVTSIGNDVFNGCSSLTSVTIPEGVTSIGSLVFSQCSNLKSVTIPSSVTSIGGYAFSSCTSLTGISIPEGVTSIGSYTFSLCDQLKSVTIPGSVTDIGSWAFSGCTSLTNVYYAGTQAQWAAVRIGSYNDNLTNAVIHFGS